MKHLFALAQLRLVPVGIGVTAERSQAVALSKHISESCRSQFWVVLRRRSHYAAPRERTETPQRMLHAVLNRMKCEAEQRTEKRAREAIANARHVDEDVNQKRFDGRIREEKQRRRRAVNEGLADDQCGADRAGIEHRGGNADDLSEARRGIDGHRKNDAQSWRAGAVQNNIHALCNKADHKGG